MTLKDTDWAFAQYEQVRDVLPRARFPDKSKTISHMLEIADDFDVFLLDAFGVLNIGQSVIAGAPEWVGALQGMGKKVMVVANGATFSPSGSLAKYAGLGFTFEAKNVVASRNVLAAALQDRSEKLWGVMGVPEGAMEELPVNGVLLGEDRQDFDRVDGFVFLSSGNWTPSQQAMLVDSLKERPRPVMAGNPDIVAPRESGLSLEPGYYAHEIARQTSVVPTLFGKPFGNIYTEVLSRIADDVPLERMVMVGDTLHTDVLGGAAAGVKTVLMADYGLFAGKDVAPFIQASGIVPDYILTQTKP